MRANRGFTLVEILIVVVILGILAAIVIPQFTEASTEAKLSSLCSDLQTIVRRSSCTRCSTMTSCLCRKAAARPGTG